MKRILVSLVSVLFLVCWMDVYAGETGKSAKEQDTLDRDASSVTSSKQKPKGQTIPKSKATGSKGNSVKLPDDQLNKKANMPSDPLDKKTDMPPDPLEKDINLGK